MGSDWSVETPEFMNEILPGLWLGSVRATNDKEILTRIGINHILSLGMEPKAEGIPEGATLKQFLDIKDNDTGNILPILPEAVEFID